MNRAQLTVEDTDHLCPAGRMGSWRAEREFTGWVALRHPEPEEDM